MKKSTVGILGVLLGVGLGTASAIYGPGMLEHGEKLAQPYAGQDTRQISSLSPEDIAELKKGAGWGLAKPAELNGYPGPAHVLELADQLELDMEQKRKVEHSFAEMQAKAKELGAAPIEAEAALDNSFKNQVATRAMLADHLQTTEDIRAALRNVHLIAHLDVTPLLNERQKAQYSTLRGYGSGGGDHAGH